MVVLPCWAAQWRGVWPWTSQVSTVSPPLAAGVCQVERMRNIAFVMEGTPAGREATYVPELRAFHALAQGVAELGLGVGHVIPAKQVLHL